MARRRSGAPRGGRRGRPLTLGGLVAVLLVLAAVYAAERFHLVPPGTLDSIFGEEKT
ncbi:HNH endonuclease, partial [Azospirillum formosense]|nr:HNH endonuclease [Azospirillum formosense]